MKTPLAALVARRTVTAFLVSWTFVGTMSLAAEPAGGSPSGGASGQLDNGEVARRLSNPVSDTWALFTEFDLSFSDGDVVKGGQEVGGRMIFEPVLPFPLYGDGMHRWNLITRPIIPILFSQPIPTGIDTYKHRGGIGDIALPMLVAPPTDGWLPKGRLLLGVGPTWLFPTSTNDAFGRQQWGAGPAAVLGYLTKQVIAGAFPQYYFGIGSRGDRPNDVRDASYLSMLYFLIFNLPDAWQVGMNPTISYDHRASSDNKWNVPIGLFVSKTTRINGIPTKFQFGVDYSVVRQDDFGQQAQFKLNIIPVVPALIDAPLFGGG